MKEILRGVGVKSIYISPIKTLLFTTLQILESSSTHPVIGELFFVSRLLPSKYVLTTSIALMCDLQGPPLIDEGMNARTRLTYADYE